MSYDLSLMSLVTHKNYFMAHMLWPFYNKPLIINQKLEVGN